MTASIDRVALEATEDGKLVAGGQVIADRNKIVEVAPIFIQIMDESVVGAFAPVDVSAWKDRGIHLLYTVWSGEDHNVGIGVARIMLEQSQRSGGALWRQSWSMSASFHFERGLEPAVKEWTQRRVLRRPVVALVPSGMLSEETALTALAGIRKLVDPKEPPPQRTRVAVAHNEPHRNGHAKRAEYMGKPIPKDGVLRRYT